VWGVRRGLLIHCRTQLHSLEKLSVRWETNALAALNFLVFRLERKMLDALLSSWTLCICVFGSAFTHRLFLFFFLQCLFQCRYTRLELCTGDPLVGWDVSGAIVLSRGRTCWNSDHQVNIWGRHGRVSLSCRLSKEPNTQLQSEFNCHK